jgi:hypothetical protein
LAREATAAAGGAAVDLPEALAVAGAEMVAEVPPADPQAAAVASTTAPRSTAQRIFDLHRLFVTSLRSQRPLVWASTCPPPVGR